MAILTRPEILLLAGLLALIFVFIKNRFCEAPKTMPFQREKSHFLVPPPKKFNAKKVDAAA